MKPYGHVVFECDALLHTYNAAFPEKSPNHTSLPTMLGFAPTLNSEKRLEIFSSFLPPKEKPFARKYLFTVEKLRETLLLSPQDVDFCFSELSDTPKNTLLKGLVTQYLGSPLQEDFTAALWDFIEKLKSGDLTVPLEGDVLFVSSFEPSFLFSELANAFSYLPAIESSQLVSPHPLYNSPPATLQLTQGRSSALLVRLCAEIKTLLNTEDAVIVAFSGTAAQKDFLGFHLDHLGLSHSFYTESGYETVESTSLDQQLLMVRQDRKTPLLERLEQSAELLKTFSDNPSKTTQQPFESTEANKQVHVVPFAPLGGGENIVYFVDDSFLSLETPDWFLEWDEAETLKRAGFAIPRPKEHRETRIAALKTLTSGRVFSNLPAEAFSESDVISVPDVDPRPVSGSESYKVAGFTRSSLSASQLERYARCPTQYFYSSVLNLNRRVTWEDSYALVFGSAAHKALESYFKLPNSEAIDFKQLRILFEEALLTLAPELSPDKAPLVFFKSHFEKILPNVKVNEESLKNLFGPRTIDSLEAPFEVTLSNTRFRGKIDRIDKLANDSLLLIDYKTGNVDFSPNQIKTGKHFQALIYWMAAEKALKSPPSAILFYDLKKGELKKGIGNLAYLPDEVKSQMTRGHALTAEKCQSLIESGTAILAETAKSLLGGDFTPQPGPVCDSCEFPAMCLKGAGYA